MLNGPLSKLLSKHPRLKLLYQAPPAQLGKEVIHWGDITNPASCITLTGLILCVIGATEMNSLQGLLLIGIGRMLDLIDGPVARMREPSRFGAGFDALCDKFAILAIIIAYLHFHIHPIGVILYVLAHNLTNATLSIVAEKRGQQPTATINGKLAMFSENVAIGLAIVGSITTQHLHLQGLAWLTMLICLPLGLASTWDYLRAATNTQQPK